MRFVFFIFLATFSAGTILTTPVRAADEAPPGGVYHAEWPTFQVIGLGHRELPKVNYWGSSEKLLEFEPTDREIDLVYSGDFDRSTALSTDSRDEDRVRFAVLKIMQLVKQLSISNPQLRIDEKDVRYFVLRGKFGLLQMLPTVYERLKNELAHIEVSIAPVSDHYELDWKRPSSERNSADFFWWKSRWELVFSTHVDAILETAKDWLQSKTATASGPISPAKGLSLSLTRAAVKLAEANFLISPNPNSRFASMELNGKTWIEMNAKRYAEKILLVPSSLIGALLLPARRKFPDLYRDFRFDPSPREITDLIFLRFGQPKLLALTSIGLLTALVLSREAGVNPFDGWNDFDEAFFIEQFESIAEDLYRRRSGAQIDEFTQRLLEEILRSTQPSLFLKQCALKLLGKYSNAYRTIQTQNVPTDFIIRPDHEMTTGLHLQAEPNSISARPVYYVAERWIAVDHLIRLMPNLFQNVMSKKPQGERLVLNTSNGDWPNGLARPHSVGNDLRPANDDDCGQILGASHDPTEPN